jgi:hypothetical protein
MKLLVRAWRCGMLPTAAAIALSAGSGSALSAGNGLSLQGHVVASGGVSRAHGGCFDVSGTIGEATAGSATGSTFTVISGFWAAPVAHPDALFRTSFEACRP